MKSNTIPPTPRTVPHRTSELLFPRSRFGFYRLCAVQYRNVSYFCCFVLCFSDWRITQESSSLSARAGESLVPDCFSMAAWVCAPFAHVMTPLQMLVGRGIFFVFFNSCKYNFLFFWELCLVGASTYIFFIEIYTRSLHMKWEFNVFLYRGFTPPRGYFWSSMFIDGGLLIS